MTTLPTGTVTFLFTDIEGSTRIAQQLGDGWPAVLERHNQIVTDAVTAQQGVVFGTEGDAVFAAFQTAPRAVAAAVAAQRALSAEDWPSTEPVRVRMGLHTGEGSVSGDSYVGIDVHRVARIANAGHGGQVLLSAATRMLAEAGLPEGVAVRDLGEFRLRDLSRPEQLAMLVVDGQPSDFPALRTLDAVPNNLPTQLTTFLGRQRELQEASELLESARLLTLTGPGGTGKTRLSLQLAADATERFHDGVYFVPLGTIGEPGLVMPTIAQALGMPDPGGGALERLAEQLAGKQVLFVLDNFEQVIDAAPQIGELLTRLPDARVLATSRSPLRVYGEQEYPVPPLALPDPRHLPDLETLSQFASVALFVERAMSVRPGFAVDAANAPAIAEICVRLDGLPLAIELAAARVRVLTPPAILARLGDRLSLLAGGSRDLPERQQTLRGAIDWSYELLDASDRVAFARLSVFASGFDLAAAERVALAEWPADAGLPPDPLDAVTSLLDKSLLRQVMGDDDEPRFQMLESIRAFALERLGELDPSLTTQRRHMEHFLALAEANAALVFGAQQRAALDIFETEHDNLRAATTFAIREGDAGHALRFLAAMWRFWHMRGYLPEARDRAERILALAGGPPQDRLRALDAAGGIAYWQGDIFASRAWYQAEGSLAEGIGDDLGVAEARYNESFTYTFDPGDSEKGRALANEALERFRKLGDRNGEGKALWGVVNSYVFDPDPSPAIPLVEESITIAREVDDRFQLGWALFTRGLIASLSSNPEVARSSYEQAIAIFRETDDLSGYALVLDGFAALDWTQGDRERAMRIAGASAALQDLSGVGLAEVNRRFAQFFPEANLEDPRLAAAYAEGGKLSVDQAIALAVGHDESQAPG
ncbi:MAG TPA: adenylate/guanylate cyclase domain-containing protein [Candidatus Limnocylindria bacterium]|nr:adenylate/guanylate cyclase domain-containing protein [Candidatus Limnocylindria bacterium]